MLLFRSSGLCNQLIYLTKRWTKWDSSLLFFAFIRLAGVITHDICSRLDLRPLLLLEAGPVGI